MSHRGCRFYENLIDRPNERLDILDKNQTIRVELFQDIYQFILKYTSVLLDHIETNDSDDDSVYTGTSGEILAILKLKDFFSNFPGFNDSRLTKRINGALDRDYSIGRSKSYPSFLCGGTGPLVVNILLKTQKTESYSQKIYSYYTRGQELIKDSSADEILYGRAGYLYTILFLKLQTSQVVPPELMNHVCKLILESGVSYTCEFPAPLCYTFHNSIYFGAAHGYVGILYMLLDPHVLSCPIITSNLLIIRQTADELFKNLFPSGNLPSSYPPRRDELVQWCHGGPGAIFLALRCYKTFQDESYHHFATKMAEDTWERGLLRKGSGLCHGVAGNAYAFLAIYNCTKNNKYLNYAFMFAKWIVQREEKFHLSASRKYSLYEGLAGALYFLCDLYKPSQALFPGFQTLTDY
ncbi:LanC-like protein 1 [Thelohanellus kitauei]|uniref:LanC-like protein 1 n=1 Tax=Thelohanellus kitauei TaxID=669202 RepID=A0A0C2JLC2_THEKT|nr:LanC-like protein 1 [Thelohanellus kitauei]